MYPKCSAVNYYPFTSKIRAQETIVLLKSD
jgi:hypothetical protein